MKKLAPLLIYVLLLFSSSRSEVVAQDIHKGNFILSPGLGIAYQRWGGITVGLNGEYAFTDEISGGSYVAFTHWADNPYQKIDFIDFGLRASYHFATLLRIREKKFDPYAGAIIGQAFSNFNRDYEINGVNYHSNADFGKGARGGVYAGAHWYLNKKVGVFGEVCSALCPLLIGATFKF